MGTINSVFIAGYLGRDMELRYTPAGAAVGTLNVATTEVWNDKAGQKQEKSEWHRCIVWGKQAENLKDYLTKGKLIGVQGRLQTRSWEDKEGNKRYTTEIRSDHITLLGASSGNGNRSTNGTDESAPSDTDMPSDSDIPF